MRKAVLHPTVHLFLPRKPADFASTCEDVLDSFDNNPNFPNAGPLVTAARAALTAYKKGIDDARNGVATVAARDELKTPLKQAMGQLVAHVQSVVDTRIAEAAAIVASVKMSLRKIPVRHVPEKQAADGVNSGDVDLAVKAVPHAVSYYWQVSSDGVHWTSAPETTGSKTTISGLTAGQTYYFRFRALTTKGMTDYSAAWPHLVR